MDGNPYDSAVKSEVHGDLRTAQSALEIGDLDMVRIALECALSHL